MASTKTAQSDIYLICCDDPMLRLERSTDLITRARKAMPDAEFLLYTFSEISGPGGPNLKEIESEMADPGLFGGDRIIKIVLRDYDATAVELFKVIAASFRPGLFVIVEMNRINASLNKCEPKNPDELRKFASFVAGSDGARALEQQNSGKKKKESRGTRGGIEARKKEAIAWLKGAGASIEIIYPPEGEQLKSWITTDARKYGLTISPEALDYIASACDNNLMVIDQSLQLMQLLRSESSTSGPLTLDEADTYFAQDARYTGYELPVAILNAEPLKSLNIISSFCLAENSGLNTALNLLIMRLDESLNAVYRGKMENIGNADDRSITAFFMKNNIKVRQAQDAHLKAIRKMPVEMLNFLTSCLAEASQAYSNYDLERAYLALQRMALGRHREAHCLNTTFA